MEDAVPLSSPPRIPPQPTLRATTEEENPEGWVEGTIPRFLGEELVLEGGTRGQALFLSGSLSFLLCRGSLGNLELGWQNPRHTVGLQGMLAPSPARSWGPGCPSHPGRGQVWLLQLEPLMLFWKPKGNAPGWTGDSGGQVNLGLCGQVTDPEAAQQASRGICTPSGSWSPETGCTRWRSLVKGGQRLSSAAAAMLRGIGPTPHHFGGPEFPVCAEAAAGLAGKGTG